MIARRGAVMRRFFASRNFRNLSFASLDLLCPHLTWAEYRMVLCQVNVRLFHSRLILSGKTETFIPMCIELVNTGSELLLGHVLNTHQQWICRELNNHGWDVARQVTVADTGSAIEDAVREGLSREDLVITTGGLGPTTDDITRDRIAALLGSELREDASVRAHIATFFERIQRPMPKSVLVQALVP